MPAFDWFRLFPDASHRLAMNLRPGDAAGYWRDSEEAEETLAERRRWLAEHPERHLGLLPEGREEVSEALAWIMKVLGRPEATPEHAAVTLEPDWLVLSGDAARAHPVLGGAVIFPSGWALEEKMGRPLHEVHAPVPGLQQALGASISTFLSRVAPLAAWERDNWGLAADPALNHHPACRVKRLDASATLDTTWVRLERQFVTRLPATQAILLAFASPITALITSPRCPDWQHAFAWHWRRWMRRWPITKASPRRVKCSPRSLPWREQR